MRAVMITFLLTGILSCTQSPSDSASESSASAASSVRLDFPAPTLSQDTVTWSHWAYNLKADNSLDSYPVTPYITNESFPVKIIENRWVKITLLPSYGGRILSILYKPTGHEQLYQNPVGSPYGLGRGDFYYNWLMVYGGIFPTLPEPEHGKTWLLPWSYRVIEQNTSLITIEMSITDTVNFAGRPGQFNNGLTGLICRNRVTLRYDSSAVEMDMTLENPAASSKSYEYWTCTTLTPGSTPGNTISPGNTRMVVPISTIKLKNDWWPWMGTKEINIVSNIFQYQNLADFSNWDDMGIGYAQNLTNSWWGVVNMQNGEGIFRIADNKNITKGLKFWTWGWPTSKDVDPSNSINCTNGSRPYIELWAGHGPEFFSDQTIAASSAINWTETYYPTIGLTNLSTANTYGALAWSLAKSGSSLIMNGRAFITLPEQQTFVTLSLSGPQGRVFSPGSFSNNATNGNGLYYTNDISGLPGGTYQAMLTLTNLYRGVLMSVSTNISL